jgi:hypothetical protein
LDKNAELFPDFKADLAPTLQQASSLFFESLIFDDKAPWSSLLTKPIAFVDQRLAKLYGLKGTYGTKLERALLDPNQRAGFLSQIGFLASHANASESSPIHRGVFIQRQLLCAALPNPPPGISVTDIVTPPELKTNRQKVTARTSPAACGACHGLINPAGFGLENYNAVGQYRNTDNGVTIDSSGTVSAGDESLRFSDAITLAKSLANSKAAQDCYVRNWMRYSLGRAERETDEFEIKSLSTKLQQSNYSVLDLMVDLTQTVAFSTRPAKELP